MKIYRNENEGACDATHNNNDKVMKKIMSRYRSKIPYMKKWHRRTAIMSNVLINEKKKRKRNEKYQ